MTAIAAFRNDYEVAIAADSLVTAEDGQPHPDRPRMAKIRLVDDTAFAIRGMARLFAAEAGTARDIDLFDAVQVAIQQGSSLAEITARLSAFLARPIEATLRHRLPRITEPDDESLRAQMEQASKGGWLTEIQVVLARCEDGVPRLGQVRFWLTPTGRASWRFGNYPSPSLPQPDGPPRILLPPSYEDDFDNRYPNYAERLPSENAVAFVHMLIAMNAPRIGPPILSVSINTDGPPSVTERCAEK
jgi:hypothetical protein